MGLTAEDTALRRCRLYYDMLTDYNSRFNLTAIKGEEDGARLHFLDSVGILGAYNFSGKTVVDVGTGAGFPGIPVAIWEQSAKVTLVDSTEKKVDFLREVCKALSLSAKAVHGRAEELAQDWDFRESYDIAVSRAVARLNVLTELCLPLVKVGGVFMAMKSADSDEEIAEAEKAAVTLGGKLLPLYTYTIPGTDITRRVVMVEKVRNTPEKYPRHYGVIKKKPL